MQPVIPCDFSTVTLQCCGMVRQVAHPARGVAYRVLHRAAVAGHSDFEPPAKAPRAAVVPRVYVAVFPGLVQRQGQGDHPL